MTGLTGYYLEMICQVGDERILWIGLTLIFTFGGFLIGGLIQRLSIRSHIDYLTGLWNRRYFCLKLSEEAVRKIRAKKQLCVAMIDVDGFKNINDSYGHAVGDILLSHIAAILKENTRSEDVVSRWGGDEFVIIFTETSLNSAFEVMERIRYKIESTFSPYHLTISSGIISLEQTQDFKDLLVRADQALYQAKARKNAIVMVNGL